MRQWEHSISGGVRISKIIWNWSWIQQLRLIEIKNNVLKKVLYGTKMSKKVPYGTKMLKNDFKNVEKRSIPIHREFEYFEKSINCKSAHRGRGPKIPRTFEICSLLKKKMATRKQWIERARKRWGSSREPHRIQFILRYPGCTTGRRTGLHPKK